MIGTNEQLNEEKNSEGVSEFHVLSLYFVSGIGLTEWNYTFTQN